MVSDERIQSITKKIYNSCSVYPRPNKNKIEQEVRKVISVTSNTDESKSDMTIIRRVSKAMDIQTKINNNSWIQYEGNLEELKR